MHLEKSTEFTPVAVSSLSKVDYSLCVTHVPYVDDALFVSEQQVPEEAGLGHVSQFDHVVHTLH